MFIPDVLYMSYELIEQNKYLIKYSDMELYSHQKIFQIYSSKAKINNSNDNITTQIQEIEKKFKQQRQKCINGLLKVNIWEMMMRKEKIL